jgi:thymidylate synthase
MRFDMRENFPVMTTKEVFFESVKAELLWFLDAGRDNKYRLSLAKLNEIQSKPVGARNIWTHDQARFASQGKAKFDGDCGRIYGAQWRDWQTADGKRVDQLANAIKLLREDPFSRYSIVTAWNPGEVGDMCLPPCHMKMQFFARPDAPDGKLWLDLSMDQRSCDLFLGVPFNIASYALLLHMVAQVVDMIPGELVITLEDCHIYTAGLDKDGNLDESKSHVGVVEEQLKRSPLLGPDLWLNGDVKDIDSFRMSDIKLVDYRHQGALKAPLL